MVTRSPTAQSLRAGWDDESNPFNMASSRAPWQPAMRPSFSADVLLLPGSWTGPAAPLSGGGGLLQRAAASLYGVQFPATDGSGEDESRPARPGQAAGLANTPSATTTSSISSRPAESAASWPGLLDSDSCWMVQVEVPAVSLISPLPTAASMMSSSAHLGALGGPHPVLVPPWCGARALCHFRDDRGGGMQRSPRDTLDGLAHTPMSHLDFECLRSLAALQGSGRHFFRYRDPNITAHPGIGSAGPPLPSYLLLS